MKDIMDWFGQVLIIQLIFAFAITGVLYALPDDSINYVSNFQTDHAMDMEGVSSGIQESMDSQMNMPLLDLGALVFYSGNIIIDLIMRMLFAIPEMISIIVGTVFTFIGVDAFIVAQIQLVVWAGISIYYVIWIIQFLMSIRSRGSVV